MHTYLLILEQPLLYRYSSLIPSLVSIVILDSFLDDEVWNGQPIVTLSWAESRMFETTSHYILAPGNIFETSLIVL
jgi:hypothetical protein